MHAGFGGRPFEVGFEGFGQQLAAEARALCQHRVLQGVRAVRPLFVHIFASAMRQSTRSGPTAQRAARAAAVAKRTPVASPPPAATATVAGGNANAPGGAGKAAATSVAPGGVPALLGSPQARLQGRNVQPTPRGDAALVT